MSSDTVYLNNGGNVDLTNQSLNAVSFSWNFGDLNTSTLTSPSHQYTQAGIYNIELNAILNPNCYQNTSSTIVVIDDITSVENELENNALQVYTNNNQLVIEGTDINLIEIKNIIGQTLVKTKYRNRINISHLNSQVLIVTTFSNNKISTKKINFIKK